MVAVLAALNAWVSFALVGAVDEKQAATARVLGALGLSSWVPFLAASAVLLLSVGLGGLRTAVLPKWLAIVTIVMGACCFGGPTGFLVWFAMPVWCIVTSVVLMRRESRAVSSPGAAQAVTV